MGVLVHVYVAQTAAIRSMHGDWVCVAQPKVCVCVCVLSVYMYTCRYICIGSIVILGWSRCKAMARACEIYECVYMCMCKCIHVYT